MNAFRYVAICLLVPVAPLCSFGQNAGNGKAQPAVATIDGQPVTEDDLIPYISSQLRPLREQEYQIKKNALDALIGQRILEGEAKKKALTTEKLLEQEVDAKVPEPTDTEIAAIYTVQREQWGGKPLQDVKLQIQQSLKRARIQQARQDYSAKLREQAKVTMLLSPPRTQVTFDPARVRGNPKAKVMIIEFSDFQCPYCGQVTPTLRNLLAKHEGSLALAFRDMPLTQIHPLAQSAAEAARCAGEQGKFWEYHDLLFGDQAGLDRNGLMAKAGKLSLDQKQFETCFASAKYRTQVEQDLQEGRNAGVSGTPGFFINGIFISGAQPEAAFEGIIRDQLLDSGSPK
jgi:protein-disulfide isomerase